MKIQKIRYESFGGIIGTERTEGLFWVDRDFLRARGFDGGKAWSGPAGKLLRGPVEMEITITLRCNLSCPSCYTETSALGEHISTADVSAALETAARMEVFHVAFGGGEPLLHPGLLELAARARELNLLPTLTTNGTMVTADWARRARSFFARVNVSLDTTGGARDPALPPEIPLAAVRRLRRAGIVSGVNIVVTAVNYHELPSLYRAAARAGADSVLVLRPKPSGRGRLLYGKNHPTVEQQRELVPLLLLQLNHRYRIPFHLDCAWAPLLLLSGVEQKRLRLLGARGCIAGELLATVDEAGMVRPCSHLPHVMGSLADMGEWWNKSPVQRLFLERYQNLQGRCAPCPVKELCSGGCPVFNNHYATALCQPDPALDCNPSGEAGSFTTVKAARSGRRLFAFLR